MTYHVKWSNAAFKSMKLLDAQTNHLIRAWVRNNLEGCENPRTIVGGKSLHGKKDGWRYRVGSYRILATIVDKELKIRIIRVGHRQGVYNKL